jgi:tRNA N6-adenosine threonylcarbamoyltransferase
MNLSCQLPRAWLKGSDDFSFSGLKTAVLHLARDNDFSEPARAAEAAASFQQAVVDVLTTKTIQAAERLAVRQILVCGGVASNKALRDSFRSSSSLPVLIPLSALCTDNAAMVAVCGYYRWQHGKTNGRDVDVVPGLSLG